MSVENFYKNKNKDPRFGEYLTFDQAMQVLQDKEKKVVRPRIKLPEFAKKLLKLK